jgi:hypothetical protein
MGKNAHKCRICGENQYSFRSLLEHTPQCEDEAELEARDDRERSQIEWDDKISDARSMLIENFTERQIESLVIYLESKGVI